MSRYEEAQDYVIGWLSDAASNVNAEEDESLAIHVQSIVYRLMDQV